MRALALLFLAACAAPAAAPLPATITAAPPSATTVAPAPPAVTATASAEAAPAALAAVHAKPECLAGERSFFSCEGREKSTPRKVVVCGADLGKPGASLALVYGEPARSEGEVRVPISADGTLVRYARYTRPRVTMLHLALTRGADTFELTDDDVGDLPKPERSTQLAIAVKGQAERVITCTGKPKGSLMQLEDHLELRDPWF
jgi:hypothetical protein